MMKRDDKLKRILSWNISSGPEEIRVGSYISPVANIKVVWVWGGWNNAVNRMIIDVNPQETFYKNFGVKEIIKKH